MREMGNDYTTTLLAPPPPAAPEAKETLKQRLLSENKKLWMLAGPSIITRFASYGVAVIAQAFIGHVGSTELAAFALTSTMLMQFATGILLGMSSALETLCGQAFGARRYDLLGLYLQRSWIVLMSCAIILLPMFIFTTPLLHLLGQEETIAKVAGTISLWFIPILFSFVFYFPLQMYLQSQSKNIIIASVAVFSLVFHVLLCWVLVVKLSMGITGAMTSFILALWIPVIVLFTYVVCGGCPNTWTGFSWNAFSDLWMVIKLSLSSGVMLCLELWYNSILVLLTGNIKNAEVAIGALSICLNVSGWELMLGVGFMAAIGVRVANELGAGNAKSAKLAILVVNATSLVIGVVLCVVFLLLRGHLAYVFTDSLEVAREVAGLSPLLAVSMLLNSLQPVLSGVAIGAGWQSMVAYVNLTCYYLVGIPLGVLLGYLIGLQVKGIWIGMLVGAATQTVVLVFIIGRVNWDEQVIKTQERIGNFDVRKFNRERLA